MMPIGMNIRVDSAMPNVAPPSENMSIVSGMSMISRFLSSETTLFMPASIAPVPLIIPNAPPMMKIRNMMPAASVMPAGTTRNISVQWTGLCSVNSKEVSSTTRMPFSFSVRSYSPAGMT